MKTVLGRRHFLHMPIATALVTWLPAAWVRADQYPNKAIRLVVPFPAGGPTDIVARPLAKLLGDELQQQLYVDNRGGAGGSIGASNVATSPPDGYTLLIGTVGTAAINPSLYKSLSYDSVKDFTPIATVAAGPVAIVASAKSGMKTIEEVVAAAKARPEKLTYGSAGNGTPGHLAGAMFCAGAGIKLTHVPYKGSAPAVTDLLGGQIDLMFDPLQSVLPHVQASKVQALAVTSRQRAPVLRSVPTVAEAAVPDFEMIAWWAIYGPANLPAPVVTRLSNAIEKVVRSPAFEGRLSPQGVQPFSTPLAKLQADEIAKWGAAVRTAGVTLE